MSKPWVYRLTVPAEKSNEFVRAMMTLGLFDDEYLEVLEEGD